jgi:hypothetical protein
MHWAKTRRQAQFNLATSGVAPFPLRELGVSIEDLEPAGDFGYGFPPLQAAIARKHGVAPECVVEAAGTSMANHLAMAALVEPGDEALIEHPAYEPMVDTARYLGAEVTRFERSEESGYPVDPEVLRRAVSPRTKLIVLTNLHNPSSALTTHQTLREVGEVAREAGAHVLVDEVYLDAVYDNPPQSAFHLGPEFVATGSLTKIYGLGALRCGWILARPELAWRIRRLDDLFDVNAAHPARALSVAAFARLDAIRERARALVEAGRQALFGFLDQRSEISAPRTPWGTTAFLRVENGGADVLLERLRADFDTIAAPGRFFGMPRHIRIGMGADHHIFREGLRRLGLALNG